MLLRVKNQIKSWLSESDFLLSKNKIILESSPDFSDNAKYVYDELLRRGINKKCKIYWFLAGEKCQYDHQHNVFFVKYDSLRGRIVHFLAKYIIDSNNYVKKVRPGQFRIYLSHGTTLKMPYEYCRNAGDIDYLTITSEYFVDPVVDLFQVPKERVIATGLPRCDGFLNDVHPKTSLSGFDKVIIWMPTYRNHVSKTAKSTNIHFNYGVPFIQTDEDLDRINEVLKKENAVLSIWYHPVEDLTAIKDINRSNIRVFDRDEFKKNSIQTYDFFKDTDALITDYSSIYYDYLLTNNPIAIAAPDIDEFSKSYVIYGGDFKKLVKAYYLNDFKDLLKFLSDVAQGKIKLKPDIKNAVKKYHKYQDGQNSKRVVDLLIKKMEKDEKSN